MRVDIGIKIFYLEGEQNLSATNKQFLILGIGLQATQAIKQQLQNQKSEDVKT